MVTIEESMDELIADAKKLGYVVTIEHTSSRDIQLIFENDESSYDTDILPEITVTTVNDSTIHFIPKVEFPDWTYTQADCADDLLYATQHWVNIAKYMQKLIEFNYTPDNL